MYMQPIVPVTQATKRSRGIGLTLVAGAGALAVAAVVMPVYWVLTALWLLVAGIVRGALTAARQAYECVLFAGEEVVGR